MRSSASALQAGFWPMPAKRSSRGGTRFSTRATRSAADAPNGVASAERTGTAKPLRSAVGDETPTDIARSYNVRDPALILLAFSGFLS